MVMVMLQKNRICAFQLLEALFTLSIVSVLLAVSTSVVNMKNIYENQDVETVFKMLKREQQEAFFTKEARTLLMKETHLVMHAKSKSYQIQLHGVCTSNFTNQVIEITDNGRWKKGGSIYCGAKTITIGIGQSHPRIRLEE